MITEDRVTFEIAKLLRDKGFDEPCDYIYDEDNLKWVYHEFIFLSGGGHATNSKLKDIGGEIITAPTLQMAMKWLREVHKCYTHICSFYPDMKYSEPPKWLAAVDYNGKDYPILPERFDSYEEAVEAAIEYCLENLV